MLKSESRYILALVAMVAAWLVSVCDVARADLTAEIETTLLEESLAGISWMLIGDSGEVSLGAAGLRDIPSQTAFTIDTRFHVGSLTKSPLTRSLRPQTIRRRVRQNPVRHPLLQVHLTVLRIPNKIPDQAQDGCGQATAYLG